MTDARPSIDPLVVSELIESAPGRVRGRLDKHPQTAATWPWVRDDARWIVACGEETVSIRAPGGLVTSRTQVECSCLLSPRCFHVLACVSILTTVAAEEESAAVDSPTPSTDDAAIPPTEAEAPSNEILATDAMLRAAAAAETSVASVLMVGAQHAGLLVQSALLRSGHACRSAGLINLGLAMLRIVEGVQRLRANQNTADSPQLIGDIASALELCQATRRHRRLPLGLIGQNRRTFAPVAVRKLRGVCAEPILTRSGYAGVCVYLHDTSYQGDADGRDIYTINELRPGDSQWIDQSYRGGIELGSLTRAARELCRDALAVQELAVSPDGRLAKGQTTRWAVAGDRDSRPLREGRFERPWEPQMEAALLHARQPPEQRPAGWDLIAFDAEVIGAKGSEVVVRVPNAAGIWRLGIAIDDPVLCFRENLALLARCPGLQLRCLGRLDIDDPGRFDLLAIVPPDETAGDLIDETTPARPVLAIPDAWRGLCNVGLDRMQSHHVRGVARYSDEVVLAGSSAETRTRTDNLALIRRRMMGLVLGGGGAIPWPSSAVHQRDLGRLRTCYQGTAAGLIDDLSVAAAQSRSSAVIQGTQRIATTLPLSTVFLACHIYQRAADRQLATMAWQRLIEGPVGD